MYGYNGIHALMLTSGSLSRLTTSPRDLSSVFSLNEGERSLQREGRREGERGDGGQEGRRNCFLLKYFLHCEVLFNL